jgi:hypothetical protein
MAYCIPAQPATSSAAAVIANILIFIVVFPRTPRTDSRAIAGQGQGSDVSGRAQGRALLVVAGVQVFRRDRSGAAILLQPHARSLAVLGDEDHAGGFEGGAKGSNSALLGTQCARLRFETFDGWEGDLGGFGQMLLLPAEQSPGGTNLFAGYYWQLFAPDLMNDT